LEVDMPGGLGMFDRNKRGFSITDKKYLHTSKNIVQLRLEGTIF
jgi:hypothetical protein